MEEEHVALGLCERTSKETGTEASVHRRAVRGWYNGRVDVQVPSWHGGGFVVGRCAEDADRRGMDGLA